MHNTTWLEFDAAALRHNLAIVKQLAPGGAILAMLKANGYGHGANWVADTLGERAQGFGLARLCEALALREHAPSKRLLLLGTLVDDNTLKHCAEARLDLVIHRLEDAQRLADTRLTTPLSIWLKRNVGMNRLGMSHEDFVAAQQLLVGSKNVKEVIHMSHFSDADTPRAEVTEEQAERLFSSSRALGTFPLSLANSAAIIAHPHTHAQWQRPGIMLYGDDPTGTLTGDNALRPVMHFKSRIIALKTVHPGDGVGYGRRWQAREQRLIATIGAGYADGYPRHATDGTPLMVNGQRASLAGRVSMDLLTADVTDVDHVKVGDEVTLWGQGVSAAEVAERCGTISYELFTQVSSRVERYYD